MSNRANRIAFWRTLGAIALFLLILTSARLFWLMMFQGADQPEASQGQLDLRNWDGAAGDTIALDGQWAFYPHELFADSDKQSASSDGNVQYVQVPGGWNDVLSPGNATPYGHGTYRLRILVSPESRLTYSIYVPSARSASALFVNGRLLAQSGQPGTAADDYKPQNVPYSASFTADDNGIIDVVVQVANYEDPRQSGIVRSIKFGTEAAITRKMELSMAMQMLVAIVFLLHALYAFILYWLGNRERRLLYFSLLVVSVMMALLLANDEKMLHHWLPINYEWGFKLVHLSLVGIAYALPECLKKELPSFWRKALPGYAMICGLLALLTLLLPVKTVITIQMLYFIIVAITMAIAAVTIIRTPRKEIRDRLLLMALVAFINHFIWWDIYLMTGIKLVFYPFDLIIAIGCLAALWFKRYFLMLADARRLAAKLQRADKLKDEFLANTSHELRNPLHGMLNISQAVLERERHVIQKESVKDLEMLLSVGRRMSLMLNDLLDVMRLKENVSRLQFHPFSLQTVAAGVIDMLRFMAKSKPIRLTNDIPADFPAVYADENRVIQILFNLLHNALKYTDEGEVTVRAHVKNGKAEVLISDTGVGMDEETLQRVFEPYEQGRADATTIGEGGFGLGLSICKNLVELHGEQLLATSVPGKGSQFRFSLQLSGQSTEGGEAAALPPAVIDHPAIDPDVAAVPSGSVAGSMPKRKANRPRILIVDDDPVNLEVMESILGLDQYEIKTFTSGQEALAALDGQEWDLVISDVMMPHMSGYALTRAIRQRFAIADLPVLLLTARNHPEDIEAGFQAGANDYVTKPVEAMEIRSRAKALTEVKRSVRERLQMEAAWLQAQIQPHFLFNTLNAVAALSEIDTDRMRKLLEAFGHFLKDKFKLRNMDEPVSIQDELNIVRSYLFIEQERLGHKLRVTWDIDECDSVLIPVLTIQPLVENAVRHGIMKRSGGGEVTIRVKNAKTHVQISVEDDGVGMEEDTLRQIWDGKSDATPGVGLKNTDLRLKQHYGKGLEIISKPGAGTTVSFVVPH